MIVIELRLIMLVLIYDFSGCVLYYWGITVSATAFGMFISFCDKFSVIVSVNCLNLGVVY